MMTATAERDWPRISGAVYSSSAMLEQPFTALVATLIVIASSLGFIAVLYAEFFKFWPLPRTELQSAKRHNRPEEVILNLNGKKAYIVRTLDELLARCPGDETEASN